jgi:CBS-domain-containing membrane protein
MAWADGECPSAHFRGNRAMSVTEIISRAALLRPLLVVPRVTKTWPSAFLSGLGGFIAIFLLAEVTANWHTLLLIAPFGASCVLAFALPQSPLAQPRNIIGGHLISTTIGLIAFWLLGSQPLAFGAAVGVAIAAMELTGTLHPPAGADPIVVIMAKSSWTFLISPVLSGVIAIVLLAIAYHRVISNRPYPIKPI